VRERGRKRGRGKVGMEERVERDRRKRERRGREGKRKEKGEVSKKDDR